MHRANRYFFHFFEFMKSATLLLIPALLLFGFSSAEAQGSKADHERSAGLRELYSGKVFQSSLEANWLEDGNSFWYRNDLRDGRREFILVDVEQGNRGPAFDHARLASAMSPELGRAVDPDQLPVQQIEFIDGGKAIRLLGRSKSWKWEPGSNQLIQEELDPEGSESTSEVLNEIRSSKGGGEESSILFVNRTDKVADILWVGTDGKRKPYAKLKPGESHSQPTYVHHVWIAVDPDGTILNAFASIRAENLAVIDGKNPPTPPKSDRKDHFTSPDGRFRAFFRGDNLHLRNLINKEEFPLSRDGSAADQYKGRVWWSPDSKRVVALRTTNGSDRKVYYVESSPRDQLQPKLHSYDYRKPGDEIPVSKPQLFDSVERRHIAIEDTLYPNPWKISELRWMPDSSAFTFLYNQRGHEVMRVLSVEAKGGTVRSLVDENPDTFFCYSHKTFLRHLPKTKEILWMSERDGWNHLYLYDSVSGEPKGQITSGEWVVREVIRVDEKSRRIWFKAGGIIPDQDPYHIHYARVSFDGSGLTVLTAGDGTHKVEYSPDRRFFIDHWSRVDHPPVHELRDAETGKFICELETADIEDLKRTGWKPPQRFVAKGRDDETGIHGIIFRPSSHDPERSYPVIESIYAGPHSAFVPKEFRSYHGMQALAELGFIVVKIDGMGTSHRSKEFHDVAWKNLGDSGFPDRIRWIKAAAAKDSSMDLDRIGIYGGSAGGQSSTRALLAHPDFYRVAVSDCGCHDNRVDKIWWNEQWMGWPIGPHYEEQSNVTQAHRLEGKLLLIVGEMDENVDPASTMQVVDALVRADRDFDMLVIPGAGHGAAGSKYGQRRQNDYFIRHLLGREPRWED